MTQPTIDHATPPPHATEPPRIAGIVRRAAERMRSPRLQRPALIWLVALVVSACAAPAATNAPALRQGAPEDAQTQADFWTQAARPYQGTILHGISEDSPPSLYIRDTLAPAFEAATGIRIDLKISTNPTIEQTIAANSAAYDFVYVEQDVIYDYLKDDLLTDLSALLAAHPELTAPDFDITDFTDFVDEFRSPEDGALYGIPIEAFIKTYAYRKDLFEDPAIRAAFEADYSYPLAPAVTIEQYRDIAEFFTRYGAAHNLDLWGSSAQATLNHNASTYEFLETIAPSFGIYNWGINLATMHATTANGGALDSDQAKAALTFWLDMLKFAPPESTTSTWTEVAETFAAGRVAQGWLYGENTAWITTDPTRSQIVGQLGVALPPSAPGVVEDAIVGAGYLGYYDGAAFGIPTHSARKEAALLWLQYLGQPSVQPEWAVETARVVHLSTFDDPLVQAQDQRLNGYFTLMKRQGNLFVGAPPVAFHVEVRDAIVPYIHGAIAGTMTPDEALDGAAAAVDALLVELGYADAP